MRLLYGPKLGKLHAQGGEYLTKSQLRDTKRTWRVQSWGPFDVPELRSRRKRKMFGEEETVSKLGESAARPLVCHNKSAKHFGGKRCDGRTWRTTTVHRSLSLLADYESRPSGRHSNSWNQSSQASPSGALQRGQIWSNLASDGIDSNSQTTIYINLHNKHAFDS